MVLWENLLDPAFTTFLW